MFSMGNINQFTQLLQSTFYERFFVLVLQLLRDKNRMTLVFMEKLLIEPFISTDMKQLMSILQMC